jgi:biotin transport system permease protein
VSDLLGVYRPGTSVLHRTPAGGKLVGLAVISVVTVALGSVATSAAALGLALGLLLVARARVGRVLRTMRGLLIMLALLAAYQTWQQGWERAFTVVGALVALILLAHVLSVTTPVDVMVDTITRALEPLRRFGVNPELVALSFSMMIRGIPLLFEIARETRQAARARGLDRSPRAFLTPLVIRMIAHARMTGDALHARGIGDD